jgi:hypothetical protein
VCESYEPQPNVAHSTSPIHFVEETHPLHLAIRDSNRNLAGKEPNNTQADPVNEIVLVEILKSKTRDLQRKKQ